MLGYDEFRRQIVAIGDSAELQAQVQAWLSRHANDPGHWEVRFASFQRPPELCWVRGASLVVVDGRNEPWIAAAECGRLRVLDLPVALIVTELSSATALVERGDARWVFSVSADEEPLLHLPSDSKGWREGNVEPESEAKLKAASPVQLDRARRTVWVDGHETVLPAQKFDLLCYLVNHSGVAVSARELVSAGLLRPSQAQRYKGLILELKNRLGPARDRLRAVPGYGYLWDAEPDTPHPDRAAAEEIVLSMKTETLSCSRLLDRRRAD